MRTRWIAVERLEAVVAKAYARGYGKPVAPVDFEALKSQGRKVPFRRWRLFLAMDCEEPYVYELAARYSARHGKRVMPLRVECETRCRKCDACLKRRSRMWIGRAMTEYEQSARTWMGTFTLSPEEHYKLDARMCAGVWSDTKGRWLRQPITLGELSPEELFKRRAQEFGAEVTRWLKRVRKEVWQRTSLNANFSYLLLAEQHTGAVGSAVYGRPHYHILLHEKQAGALILDGEIHKAVHDDIEHIYVRDNAVVRKHWTLGYTRFEGCINAKSAIYLCKYLTKGMQARVRASINYGRTETPKQNAQRAKGGHEGPPRKLTPQSNLEVE